MQAQGPSRTAHHRSPPSHTPARRRAAHPSPEPRIPPRAPATQRPPQAPHTGRPPSRRPTLEREGQSLQEAFKKATSLSRGKPAGRLNRVVSCGPAGHSSEKRTGPSRARADIRIRTSRVPPTKTPAQRPHPAPLGAKNPNRVCHEVGPPTPLGQPQWPEDQPSRGFLNAALDLTKDPPGKPEDEPGRRRSNSAILTVAPPLLSRGSPAGEGDQKREGGSPTPKASPPDLQTLPPRVKGCPPDTKVKLRRRSDIPE
ncbi:PREDICTED: basic salivary proline-rich protein 2-like [Cyphomyrmex costatus]|uniref:basic salivary proline-rich protein 2-like n=1 Tax=Cyphomyrmex costatus TaxID=456900 RepID=UPI0008522DF1|nr:PREDICTED: basic salivary proline-rich protein 2-like [Cyphomyrmex costatus]